MCCIRGCIIARTSDSQTRQQGWSSIIIPQWIKMSISAHSNTPSAGLWRLRGGLVHLRPDPPSNPPSLHTCKPSNTSRSHGRGTGTCLETTSASPRWPVELSQLQNQGHTRRGPWFYHNKDSAAATACNWLRETFQSIFPLWTRSLYTPSSCLSLLFFLIYTVLGKDEDLWTHPEVRDQRLQRG